MHVNRRSFLSATVSIAILAGICGPTLASDKEPIRVGVPTALTGPYAELGEQGRRAVQFAVDQANENGGVDGRKVEVQFLDTQAKPELARQQAEKLALSGYNLLLGTVTTGEGLAIASMLERWDALYISTFNKANTVTGSQCTARMFRANHADASDTAAAKVWLQERSERKWVVMGSDTAWGRDSGASFKNSIGELGGEVVAESYAALGTNDFAPYIQKFADSNAEGLWVALTGRDAINFAQQAAQFGLLKKLTVAGISFVTDSSVITLGDLSEGIWSTINYSSTIDTPENKEFVAAWGKKHPGTWPSTFEGETYIGMQVLFQAIEKAGSVAPTDLAAALSGGSFDVLTGKMTMRAEDHQLVVPNYFGRVQEYEGALRPVITLAVPPELSTIAPDGSCKL